MGTRSSSLRAGDAPKFVISTVSTPEGLGPGLEARALRCMDALPPHCSLRIHVAWPAKSASSPLLPSGLKSHPRIQVVLVDAAPAAVTPWLPILLSMFMLGSAAAQCVVLALPDTLLPSEPLRALVRKFAVNRNLNAAVRLDQHVALPVRLLTLDAIRSLERGSTMDAVLAQHNIRVRTVAP